jgi:hypothetical protein
LASTIPAQACIQVGMDKTRHKLKRNINDILRIEGFDKPLNSYTLQKWIHTARTRIRNYFIFKPFDAVILKVGSVGQRVGGGYSDV